MFTTTSSILITVAVIVAVVILSVWGILSRYKKCQSDQILVVYGKTKGTSAAKCYHGGAAFIWPVIQGYKILSTKPMQMTCNLQGAISKQKIKVNVNTTVTAAISTDENIMTNAAVRWRCPFFLRALCPST